MAKRNWQESRQNAGFLGLMQPNLETGARQTGRYTLFSLAGGNFREIGHFVGIYWPLCGEGRLEGLQPSLLSWCSVLDGRKLTKQHLNRPYDTERL